MRSRLVLLSLVAAVGVTVHTSAASAQVIVRRGYVYPRYDYDRMDRQRELAARTAERNAERAARNAERVIATRMEARERAARTAERAMDRRIEARERETRRAEDRRWEQQDRAMRARERADEVRRSFRPPTYRIRW